VRRGDVDREESERDRGGATRGAGAVLVRRCGGRSRGASLEEHPRGGAAERRE
jgi:hypothetical protein